MRPFKRRSVGLAPNGVLSLPVGHTPVSVSRACRDGGCGPSVGHQDIAQQQLSGRVLGPPGCSWSGVRQGDWEVSLLHFLWQIHVLGNAVLCSSRGGRASKSWQVEAMLLLENTPRPLLLSLTTCLRIFAVSPD